MPDTGLGQGKRLDVNPLALPLFEDAKRVWWVLEGELKADSLLSHYPDEAVFSVPSVTLWHAQELEEFAAKYLTGKLVIIVADSDGAEPVVLDHNGNPELTDKGKPKRREVMFHAQCARTFLLRMGIRAVVAMPPQYDFGPDAKHGLDDWLVWGALVEGPAKAWPWESEPSRTVVGRAPGDLLSLVVEDSLVSDAFDALVSSLAFGRTYAARIPGYRQDRSYRDLDVLSALEGVVDANGEVKRSIQSLAAIFNVPRTNVIRSLEDLEALGFITREEGEVVEEKFVHLDKATQVKTGKKAFMQKGLAWDTDSAPVITLTEALRPTRQTLPLRDWLKENHYDA